MVQINYARREVSCKVVYYGPGLSGKTTNLEIIHQKDPNQDKGNLTSIATEGDRTLYFDYKPLDLGQISGMATKFQLYTVPGQTYYNSTRKLVLTGVDGVVFVADSQKEKMKENLESLENLEENLKEHEIELAKMPFVLQYNKRDLPDIFTFEELDERLNKLGVPALEAVAFKGTGVFETLKEIASRVMNKISKEANLVKDRSSRIAPKREQAAAPTPPTGYPQAPPGYPQGGGYGAPPTPTPTPYQPHLNQTQVGGYPQAPQGYGGVPNYTPAPAPSPYHPQNQPMGGYPPQQGYGAPPGGYGGPPNNPYAMPPGGGYPPAPHPGGYGGPPQYGNYPPRGGHPPPPQYPGPAGGPPHQYPGHQPNPYGAPPQGGGYPKPPTPMGGYPRAPGGPTPYPGGPPPPRTGARPVYPPGRPGMNPPPNAPPQHPQDKK